MKKKLARILNINISVIFSQLKVLHMLNKNIKLNLSKENVTNCVYLYKCPCSKGNYIGETKLRIDERMKSHMFQRQDSSIFSHVTTCDHFKTKFRDFCLVEGLEISSISVMRKYIIENIKILEKCSSDFDRRWLEGFNIRIRSPHLNKKEDFCYKSFI